MGLNHSLKYSWEVDAEYDKHICHWVVMVIVCNNSWYCFY